MRHIWIGYPLLLLATLGRGAGATTLVQDIRTGTVDARPAPVAQHQGIAYFSADGGLWQTDGSAAGTGLLMDSIAPGPGAVSGGLLYFAAEDAEAGRELWRSDGVAAGTHRVADLVAGAGSSSPTDLVDRAGMLFFAADGDLWRSTGPDTFTPVRNGPGDPRPRDPAELTVWGPAVYFRAAGQVFPGDPGSDLRLWKTNDAGTSTAVVRPGVGPSYPLDPRELTVAGPWLYFVAWDQPNGRELWKTDGTPLGTSVVADLVAGPGSSLPSHLVAVGSTLFFQANDGTHGPELWATDGTAAGTRLVRDIEAGAPGGRPESLTALGTFLVFTAGDGRELWRSDGTEAGTVQVAELVPGGTDDVSGLCAVGSQLFFAARGGVASGHRLWVSDGASATQPVGPDVSLEPQDLYAFGSLLLFAGSDTAHGQEPWRSDGSEAGTFLLHDVADREAGSEPAAAATLADGRVLFTADDGVHGREIWSIAPGVPGEPPTAALLADITPQRGSSRPGDFRLHGGHVYFRAADPDHGEELWRTDGTSAGTALVRDICPGSCSSSPTELAVLGGLLYFAAEDATTGRELWRSDGTADGTSRVKDIRPGPESSAPDHLTALQSTLHFGADDGGTGRELWRSDGTPAGTARVADLGAGAAGSFPAELTAFGSTLLFRASYIDWGAELWRSDGSAGGTTLVADIRVGSSSSFPDSLTPLGDSVLFTADVYSLGRELWRTDASPAGTALVRRLGSGLAGPLLRHGDAVYFAAGGAAGVELWRSDGSDPGTVLVHDIAAGEADASPQDLLSANGLLWFSATDPERGRELWVSDGTAGAAFLAADVLPGPGSSSPVPLTALGQHLLFRADDGVHGGELWLLPGPILRPLDVREHEDAAQATIALTLHEPASSPVSLDYATEDGDAQAGSDYVSVSGSLTFQAGEMVKTVAVPLLDDGLDEPDETFFLVVGAVTGATPVDDRAEVWLKDDDAVASLSLGADVTVVERDGPGLVVTIPVALSAPSGRTVVAGWTTTPGTATAPEDFAAASGTLTLAAGETAASLQVTITGDTLPERTERFQVVLQVESGVVPGDTEAVVVVRDDEPVPVDFLATGRSQAVVYRSGAWLMFEHSNGQLASAVFTGQPDPGCVPAPADFDGDGRPEFSQLCAGVWHVYEPGGELARSIVTGDPADRPVPADYDGDGRDEMTVFRRGAWLTFDAWSGQLVSGVFTGEPPHFTGGTPTPLAADFDGDGKADRSVYSGGPWHFFEPDGSYERGVWTGSIAGDVPVAGDYDADGRDDLVVFRSGAWLWFDSATGSYDPARSIFTGAPPHFTGGISLPAPLDVNGNGGLERAIWSGGPWHFYQPSGAYDRGIWCGAVPGDLPVSARPLP